MTEKCQMQEEKKREKWKEGYHQAVEFGIVAERERERRRRRTGEGRKEEDVIKSAEEKVERNFGQKKNKEKGRMKSERERGGERKETDLSFFLFWISLNHPELDTFSLLLIMSPRLFFLSHSLFIISPSSLLFLSRVLTFRLYSFFHSLCRILSFRLSIFSVGLAF